MIIHLDASLLKQNSCMRRIALRAIEGWTKDTADRPNTKAEYGTAFHKALAIWYENKDIDAAVTKAVDHYTPFEASISDDDFRTCLHLELAIRRYFKHYENDVLKPVLDSTGKPLLEVKFSWPAFKTDEHEFIYSGTIDMVADYAGTQCLTDHKTTGLFQKALFFEKFNLDIQAMFYIYMYRMISGETFYRPFLVNGIFIKKVTQKAKSFDGVDFQRSQLIEYSDNQMTLFGSWLGTIAYNLRQNTTAQLRDMYDFAACQQTWGLCEFFNVCSAGSNDMQQMILQSKYIHKYYDPTKFQE